MTSKEGEGMPSVEVVFRNPVELQNQVMYQVWWMLSSLDRERLATE